MILQALLVFWAACAVLSAAVPLATPAHNTTTTTTRNPTSLDVDISNWGHAVPMIIKNQTAGSNSTQIIIPPGSAIVKATGEIVTGACYFSDAGIKCYSALQYATKLDAEAAQTTRTLDNMTLPLNKHKNIANDVAKPLFHAIGIKELRNPWRGGERDGADQAVTDEIDCSAITRQTCTLAIQYTMTYTASVTLGVNFGKSAGDVWAMTGFTGSFTASVSSATAQTMTIDIRGTRGKLIWRPRVFDYGGVMWERTCHGPICNPPVEMGPVVAEAPVEGKRGSISARVHTDRWLRDQDWYHLDNRDVPWRFDAGDIDNVYTPMQCAQMAFERDKNLAIWRSDFNKCWFKDVDWQGARTFDTWGGFVGRYDIPGYDRWMPGSTSENERQQWINDRACDVIANGNDGRFYCKRFEYCESCVMMLRRN